MATFSSRKRAFWPLGLVMLFSAALLPVAGCSQFEESKINTHRLEIVHDNYADTVPAEALRGGVLDTVAEHYKRYGDGPLNLAVVYNPHSRKNTAMNASMEVTRISTALRKAGISNVSADVLPVADKSDDATVLISYATVKAQAPSECANEILPGMYGTKTDLQGDYSLGCTVESFIAKQVYRPKDLLGRDGIPGASDGRRGANIVEGYRSGVPNEDLEGEQATEE